MATASFKEISVIFTAKCLLCRAEEAIVVSCGACLASAVFVNEKLVHAIDNCTILINNSKLSLAVQIILIDSLTT